MREVADRGGNIQNTTITLTTFPDELHFLLSGEITGKANKEWSSHIITKADSSKMES